MSRARFKALVLNATLLACSGQAALMLQIGQNYSGSVTTLPLPNAGFAVSTNHVVQFIDGRYSVFGKATGALLQAMTAGAFWTNAGVTMPTGVFASTPRVVYDFDSHRWVVAMVDVPSKQLDNRFLLAISVTDDPTGAWRGVGFRADPSDGYFADFPTLGIDPSGVYLAADIFDEHDLPVGSTLVALPKNPLLGNPPSTADRATFRLLSYDRYGAVLQPAVSMDPASTPEIVLAVGDLGYDFQPHSNLVAVTVEGANISNGAVLGNPKNIEVPPFLIPLNAAQPGVFDNIDNGDTRISATLYRVGDVLYAAHSLELNNRAAIQWFKIDARTLSVVETGFVNHPDLDLYYPSITANTAGVVVIVFNASSSSNFISSYAILGEVITGSLQFGSMTLLKAGAAGYRTNSELNSWGNYSAATVDPADPDHFWAMTMYAASPTAWGTQITELIAAPVHLALSATGTNVTISWPAEATGYRLQLKPNLAGENWTMVPEQPKLEHNRFTISLESAADTQFFRLIK